MIAFSDSEMYLNWMERDSNWLVTEAAFWSFWNEIELIKTESDINKTKINKIDWRRHSIIKIVNSQSFNNKQDSKYCQIVITSFHKKLVCLQLIIKMKEWKWQLNWTLIESNIHDNLFEAIIQLLSTKGRLFVVRNRDKIIRHTSFIYQNKLNDSHGICIGKIRLELSEL